MQLVRVYHIESIIKTLNAQQPQDIWNTLRQEEISQARRGRRLLLGAGKQYSVTAPTDAAQTSVNLQYIKKFSVQTVTGLMKEPMIVSRTDTTGYEIKGCVPSSLLTRAWDLTIDTRK